MGKRTENAITTPLLLPERRSLSSLQRQLRKRKHDVVGHYARPDELELKIIGN